MIASSWYSSVRSGQFLGKVIFVPLLVLSLVSCGTKNTNSTENKVSGGESTEVFLSKEQSRVEDKESKSLERGKQIFLRLREQVCNVQNLCLIPAAYYGKNSVLLVEDFPVKWGPSLILVLPVPDWNSLSKDEQKDLQYFCRKVGIDKIMTGRILPSAVNPSRNSIGMDTTVWSK